MTVFQHKPALPGVTRKPTRYQVLRRMGLIALTSTVKYGTWLLVFAVVIVGCLLTGAVLVGGVIALLMAVALFWVPWPTDWFLQLVTGVGVLLYALGFIHLIYKLYRHAARIERNKKEYIR